MFNNKSLPVSHKRDAGRLLHMLRILLSESSDFGYVDSHVNANNHLPPKKRFKNKGVSCNKNGLARAIF
jgi:hypothetical protein